MKKLLLGSVAVFAFSAGPADAADLAPRAVPMQPAPVAFSWSGCYIGGHAGGAWSKKTFRAPGTGPVLPTATTVAFASFTGGGNATVAANLFNANGVLVNTGAFDQTISGPIAGGQVGCNLQFAGGWVIGVEGDASWAGLSGTKTGSFSTTGTGFLVTGVPSVTASGAATKITSPGTITTTAAGMLAAKTDFLATVTGRVGYAWDRLLLYAKGGGAFAHDKYRLATTTTQTLTTASGCLIGCTVTNVQSFDFNVSQDRAGWTVGAGLEYAIAPNWSVKAEWDFLDFGTRNVKFTDASSGSFDVSVRERVHEFKVGVNYLFNFGKTPSPVVARY